MPHKAHCGVDDTEMRLCIEKHLEISSMKVYPNSHTRLETQMEMADSRLCVWDKIASEWSGGEEWRIKRKKSIRRQRTREFVTLARMIVKHSVVHRPTSGDCAESNKEKKAEDIGTDNGTARLITFHSYRRYHGTHVWRQHNCRRREQWALRDGPKSTRTKLSTFSGTGR